MKTPGSTPEIDRTSLHKEKKSSTTKLSSFYIEAYQSLDGGSSRWYGMGIKCEVCVQQVIINAGSRFPAKLGDGEKSSGVGDAENGKRYRRSII